jgi:type VI protein secretion system component VasF
LEDERIKKNKGGAQARRFLEMLNTPLAVLVVLAVVVAVNTYLVVGYYLPRTTSPGAPPISSPAPTSAPTTAPSTATGSP